MGVGGEARAPGLMSRNSFGCWDSGVGEPRAWRAGASDAVWWSFPGGPKLGAQVRSLDKELRSHSEWCCQKKTIPQCTENEQASAVNSANGEKLLWGPKDGKHGSETEVRASGVLRRDWTWGMPSEEGGDTWLGVNKGSAGRGPARGPVAPGGRAGPVPGASSCWLKHKHRAALASSIEPAARRLPGHR